MMNKLWKYQKSRANNAEWIIICMREVENDEWLMIMADENSDSNQRMLKISNDVMLFKIGSNCLMMIYMK